MQYQEQNRLESRPFPLESGMPTILGLWAPIRLAYDDKDDVTDISSCRKKNLTGQQLFSIWTRLHLENLKNSDDARYALSLTRVPRVILLTLRKERGNITKFSITRLILTFAISNADALQRAAAPLGVRVSLLSTGLCVIGAPASQTMRRARVRGCLWRCLRNYVILRFLSSWPLSVQIYSSVLFEQSLLRKEILCCV